MGRVFVMSATTFLDSKTHRRRASVSVPVVVGASARPPRAIIGVMSIGGNARTSAVEEALPWQARSPNVTSVRRPRMIGGMCAQVIKRGVSERLPRQVLTHVAGQLP